MLGMNCELWRILMIALLAKIGGSKGEAGVIGNALEKSFIIWGLFMGPLKLI
jgi:hypothetical protein